jgi:hypothetical protein
MTKNWKIALATIALPLTMAICAAARSAHQQKSETKAASAVAE